MARTRRFRVESLAGTAVGQTLALNPADAHHAKVLRLKTGDPVELFDVSGGRADGSIAENDAQGVTVLLESVASEPSASESPALILATAWPKGKRAAMLVEKCAELGVGRIIPIQYERSVVEKDDESEGVERLRRIAIEAAKQSGRTDVPRIEPARTLEALLKESAAVAVLLDPRAERGLGEWFAALPPEKSSAGVLLIIGPEGGFSNAEIQRVDAAGVARVRLAEHILRVETAALAACAVIGALQCEARLRAKR